MELGNYYSIHISHALQIQWTATFLLYVVTTTADQPDRVSFNMRDSMYTRREPTSLQKPCSTSLRRHKLEIKINFDVNVLSEIKSTSYWYQ